MKSINYFLAIILFLFAVNIRINAQIYDQSISGSTNAGMDEGEAHIAIDPTDSMKMVMGYMESRQTGVTFKVYHSSDGGNSWQPSTLNTIAVASSDFPGFTAIGGGDIVFSYDKSGKLYCSWIHVLGNLAVPWGIDSVKWTSYWASSTDNGHTFNLSPGNDRFFGEGKFSLRGGITVHNYKDGLCDRQWMATDLSNGTYQNRLYVGYINYTSNVNQSGLRIKTKDSGQTGFSTPVTAYGGGGQLTNIAVDTSGILHYTFCDIDSNELYHVFSLDGGMSFTNPHLIYNGIDMAPTNTTTHDRENASPSLSIDGQNNLHLVWGDFVTGQSPLAFYSNSIDTGKTWTNLISLDSLFGSEVFMPVVTSFNNKVTIGANVINSSNQSEYFIISSYDNGQTFTNPVKLSSGLTNLNSIGQSFLGDYSSSVRTDCNIFSLWTDCRNSSGCKQYIAKYNECLTTGIVELTPVESELFIERLYPNPTSGNLTVSLKSEGVSTIKYEVFSVRGQLMKQQDISLEDGVNKIAIDLHHFSRGNYILKVLAENGTFITRSIVLQ